jgi:hypothetical protein
VSLSIADRLKIASLGGIEAIIKAMYTHKDRIGVQENACGALENLAANEGLVYFPASSRARSYVRSLSCILISYQIARSNYTCVYSSSPRSTIKTPCWSRGAYQGSDGAIS